MKNKNILYQNIKLFIYLFIYVSMAILYKNLYNTQCYYLTTYINYNYKLLNYLYTTRVVANIKEYIKHIPTLAATYLDIV